MELRSFRPFQSVNVTQTVKEFGDLLENRRPTYLSWLASHLSIFF